LDVGRAWSPLRIAGRRRAASSHHLLLRREPVRRVALVTGASRGIGRAIAEAFAREGLAVALAARTRADVEVAARELREHGAETRAVTLDVGDADAAGRAVGPIAATLGPVDVLVNNAGVAESAPLARTDLDLWERHLRVNVTGPFLLSRAVVPGMVK